MKLEWNAKTKSALVVGLSVLTILGGLYGPRFGYSSPTGGLKLFVFGLVGGAVACLIVGGLTVRATRVLDPMRRGLPRNRGWFRWLGVIAGATLFTVAAALGLWARSFPRMHDITTSPEDPPAFEAALRADANWKRDMVYPVDTGDAPRLQRSAYPDIVPIDLDVSPDRALDEALSAANRLGWTVMDVSIERTRFEAYDKTSVFGFVDDVVVRVAKTPAGCRVDVRSTSREGKSDVGENARRIRRFKADLLAGLARY